ncbi:hypothetical protein CK203_115345 [Vitis vinifera]|uniref:Uncharacterized protein n=1 Tax=Vitis vinifera TaxID=29760 RepID=A0A438C993_VITVI|nr:hypothetical protein CK203_115345 [Vitis vinifera]
MILRSLQPRFARHLMGFPHMDFESLVQALYGIEKDIARGLWPKSSPSDSKGKKPSGGQRLRNVAKCNHEPSTGPAYSMHAVPPFPGGIHHIDFAEDDDIHMLSWDDGLQNRLFWMMVMRPFDGAVSHEEVKREDDELLSQIRVETTTTPEGLIHMITADKATCIVFSDDDLPLEGSNHTHHLYIIVGYSSHRVPSILLDNDSALSVCRLATAIALSYAPSDFGPFTQTIRAYDNTKMEVMGTLMIELLIGPATFSILLQVLRIPTSFNLLLSRPWIHRVGVIPYFLHQKVKFIHDRDFVAMSFDQHSNTVILDMMRGMSFLPSMGYMARLHRERVRARLTCTLFDYPVHPYRMSLEDYFVKGSELGVETSGAPVLVIIASSSLNRANFLSLCFPEETTDCGIDVEPTGVTDGVVPHDEYRDEMDMMSMSQITEMVQLELASPFNLFGVFAIEVAEEIQTVFALELIEDVAIGDDLFDDTFSSIEGAFDFVDQPLSFDILSRFISRLDDVYDSASMDLSIFKYFPVSCDSICISAPHSPTLQIFDIDYEIAKPDSDRDSFDHDSDPIDETVSPTIGDIEKLILA